MAIINLRDKSRTFLRWLAEPIESPMPSLDQLLWAFPKILYLIMRILLRATVGKTRRNQMQFLNDFHNALVTPFSISYRLLAWLPIAFSISANNEKPKINEDSRLLKISVPKYGYQYYCRVHKGDFTPDREEDIVSQFFKPKRGDIVMDIGAHIGRYSIISSKQVGTEGRVIAVEASPSNFEMLNINLALNGITNVLAVNCAACAGETEIKLYEPNTNGSIYSTIMTERVHSTNDRCVIVKGKTLDLIAQTFGITSKVNWIKIDVEGAELEVLKGASAILSSCTNLFLLIEVHNIGDKQHFNKIVTLLKGFSFMISQEKVYDGGERHVVFKKQ